MEEMIDKKFHEYLVKVFSRNNSNNTLIHLINNFIINSYEKDFF